MQMQTARQLLASRGLDSQQMAFTGDHDAYSLQGGRAVVITGDDMLESILIIHNADKPKAEREYEDVERFTY